MNSVLEGIRVLEVATFVAGPVAGTIMSDFGAEVIHVEPPAGGDPHRYLYQVAPLPKCEQNYAWILASRNKRSLALDLKKAEGRAVLYDLVATCDVFITNYQPSVLDDLRVRYADLEPLNPRLVYAHVTGYGEQGSEVEKPGYDASAWWARSGLMDLVRSGDAEVAMAAPAMGDNPTAATLFGAIMLALYRRERSGRGAKVNTSLMANGLWANSIMAQAALCDATFVPPYTHRESPNPLLSVYTTKDGRQLFLVMIKEAYEWSLFCDGIERPDLKADPRFDESSKRRENAAVLVALLDDVFAQKTLSEWVVQLDRHKVTFGVVQQSVSLPQDPQMRANDLYRAVIDQNGLETIDSPIQFAGYKKTAPRLAPELGQDSVAVLRELGRCEDAIAQLISAGVVKQAP